MKQKTTYIENRTIEKTLRSLTQCVRKACGLDIETGSHRDSGSPALITARDAAAHLNVAEKTLANWRTQGHGPGFVKVGGRVVYRVSDVDAWLAQRTAIVRRQRWGRR